MYMYCGVLLVAFVLCILEVQDKYKITSPYYTMGL